MLSKLEQILAIVLFTAMIILTTLQIVMRFVFKSGLIWNEDMLRLIFVWLVCIGIVRAFRHGTHVSVDIFVSLFPRRLRYLLEVWNHTTAFVLMAALVYIGLRLTRNNWDLMHVTMPLPVGMLYLAVPVTSALSLPPILRAMIAAWNEAFRGGKGGDAYADHARRHAYGSDPA